MWKKDHFPQWSNKLMKIYYSSIGKFFFFNLVFTEIQMGKIAIWQFQEGRASVNEQPFK